MQTRFYEIIDPLGATRIEIADFKDGKAKRRERRKQQRKM